MAEAVGANSVETKYYELLGISLTASEDDVRRAIRDQRKRWSQLQGHPKLEIQHEAQLMVRELSEAESVLIDENRRRAYDARLRPPAPVATAEEQPVPSPVPSHHSGPEPRPEPWRPPPTPRPMVSPRAKRTMAISGLGLAVAAAAVAFLAPLIGAWVREATGNLPAMAVERYEGSFDSTLAGTNRLVGSAVLGLFLTVGLAVVVFRWRKLAAPIVLVIGVIACTVVGLKAAGSFDREARELILDGMCNGGQGSTGHTTLGGRKVEFGLTRGCNSLVVWSGTTEIRTIPAPTGVDLDLHVVGTESKQGGHYVAAASMAPDQGGPYTLVIFRIDKDAQPKRFDLDAPNRGQGFPVLGEHGLFQFERELNGEGMVTAVDPDTGEFVWDVTCPPSWEYLLFAYDGMIDARGTGDTINCVQEAANQYRKYQLDTDAGRLGDLLEERPWAQ